MTNDDVATLIAAFAMIGQDVLQRGDSKARRSSPAV